MKNHVTYQTIDISVSCSYLGKKQNFAHERLEQQMFKSFSFTNTYWLKIS